MNLSALCWNFIWCRHISDLQNISNLKKMIWFTVSQNHFPLRKTGSIWSESGSILDRRLNSVRTFSEMSHRSHWWWAARRSHSRGITWPTFLIRRFTRTLEQWTKSREMIRTKSYRLFLNLSFINKQRDLFK